MFFLASRLLSTIDALVMGPELWHCVYTAPNGDRVHGDPSYPRVEAIATADELNAMTDFGHWSAEPR